MLAVNQDSGHENFDSTTSLLLLGCLVILAFITIVVMLQRKSEHIVKKKNESIAECYWNDERDQRMAVAVAEDDWKHEKVLI